MRRVGEPTRRGFVLLAVLGAVILAGTIGMAGMRITKNAMLTSANRIAFIQARWFAYGCLERARSAFAESQLASVATGSEWAKLDSTLSESSLLRSAPTCLVRAQAAGDRLNVNTATPNEINAALLAAGLQAPASDSLVDALLDWRDSDDHPRPLGAERSWYSEHELLEPRNGPLGSASELPSIRGFAARPMLIALLDVEEGRPSLSRSPAPVLASLPGFSPELVRLIVARRSRGPLDTDLSKLAGFLSDTNRKAVLSAQGQLHGQFVLEPDAWILQSRAHTAGSSAIVVVEVTIGREANSTVVHRLREWWE